MGLYRSILFHLQISSGVSSRLRLLLLLVLVGDVDRHSHTRSIPSIQVFDSRLALPWPASRILVSRTRLLRQTQRCTHASPCEKERQQS